mmetsp:Transcript_22661/g.36626  ORF Transcript_22661/g.36626 Transcript_22661/m.36626 type:complete len:431 (-) Transcript_22661:505-1797(-)
MADHEHGALPGRQGLHQHLDRVHIEVVGGLVQQEDVVGDQAEDRQRHAGFLPAAQHPYLPQRHIASQTQGTHCVPGFEVCDGWIALPHHLQHVVQRGLPHGQVLGQVLREHPQPQPLALRPRPPQQGHLARERLEQRGLPHPVGAQHHVLAAPLQHEVHALQQRALAPAERGAAREAQRLHSPGRGRGQGELGAARLPLDGGRGLQLVHPLQLLHPALRGAGLAGLGPEAVHEPLELLDLPLLGLVRPLRLLHPLLAQPQEGGVVRAEVVQPAAADLGHGVAPEPAQQVLVVRDHHHRPLVPGQVPGQPVLGGLVQVVGRLVQQQRRGAAQQQPRQADAHLPAAAEVRTRPAVVRGLEAQPLQHTPHRLRLVVAAERHEEVVGLAELLEVLVAGVLHAEGLELLQLALGIVEGGHLRACFLEDGLGGPAH